MPENNGEIVQTFRVMVFDMECVQCKRGRMRFTGFSVQSLDGEKYLHVCSACNFQAAYDKIYPSHQTLGEGETLHIIKD